MLKNGIKTAHNKSLKRSYKHLSKEEYRVMKLIERAEQAEKYLYGHYGFYTRMPRIENGQIDWQNVPENEYSMFVKCNKAKEKFNKIDDEIVSSIQDKFNRSQFTYSQSF